MRQAAPAPRPPIKVLGFGPADASRIPLTTWLIRANVDPFVASIRVQRFQKV